MLNFCMKKFHIGFPASISTANLFKTPSADYLVIGFDDRSPCIMSYHMDAFAPRHMNQHQANQTAPVKLIVPPFRCHQW